MYGKVKSKNRQLPKGDRMTVVCLRPNEYFKDNGSSNKHNRTEHPIDWGNITIFTMESLILAQDER